MTSPETIRLVASWAGASLPEAYLDLLRLRGGTFCNDVVHLYGADELIERNEVYETKIYCPGFLTIGDDSGGRAVIIALGELPGPVYLADHGSMRPCDFHVIAPDIATWTINKFSVDDHRDCCPHGWIRNMPSSPVHRVRIRWDGGRVAARALKVLRMLSPVASRMPIGGLAGMLGGGRSFDLGIIPEYQREDLSRQLADAGFVVTSEREGKKKPAAGAG